MGMGFLSSNAGAGDDKDEDSLGGSFGCPLDDGRDPLARFTATAVDVGLIKAGDKLDRNVVELCLRVVEMAAQIGDNAVPGFSRTRSGPTSVPSWMNSGSAASGGRGRAAAPARSESILECHSSSGSVGAASSGGISLARMKSKAAPACRAAVKIAVRSLRSTCSQLSR